MIFADRRRHPAGLLRRPPARRHGIDSFCVGGSLLGVVIPVFFLGLPAQVGLRRRAGLVPAAGRQDVAHRRHPHHQLLRARRPADPGVGRGLGRAHAPDPARRSRWAPSRSRSSCGSPGRRCSRCVSEDYVRTARPRAWPQRTVRRRHILRNAHAARCRPRSACRPGCCCPARSSPRRCSRSAGVGPYLFDAIAQRDYPVLQGFILIIALMYVAGEPAGRHLLRPHRPEGACAMTVLPPQSSGCRRGDVGDARRPRRSRRARTRAASASGASASRRLRRNPVAIVGAVIVACLRAGGAVRAAARAVRARPARSRSSRDHAGIVPGPSDEHPLGLDNLGRDLFSRLIRRPAVAAHRCRLDRARRRRRHGARARWPVPSAAGSTRRHAVRRHHAVDPRPAAGGQRRGACSAGTDTR